MFRQASHKSLVKDKIELPDWSRTGSSGEMCSERGTNKAPKRNFVTSNFAWCWKGPLMKTCHEDQQPNAFSFKVKHSGRSLKYFSEL